MKIIILGRPGAGKTSFAHTLSQKTGTKLHLVDKHFFDANWVPTSAEKFNAWQDKIVSQKSWIIEGNGTRHLESRLAAADIVIVFDFPRLLCTWRVLKRRFLGSRFYDRPLHCPNRITWNLLWYLWYKFDRHLQNRFYKQIPKYPDVKIVTVTSDEEARKLLEKHL